MKKQMDQMEQTASSRTNSCAIIKKLHKNTDYQIR